MKWAGAILVLAAVQAAEFRTAEPTFTTGPTSNRDTSVRDKLAELRRWHMEGLIDKDELKQSKATLLKEFVGKTKTMQVPKIPSGKKVKSHKLGGIPPTSPFQNVVWSDNFTTLDLSKWQHEITMSGGGNWEFEYYANNRSNSYVQDGVLYLKPTFTADTMGESKMLSGGGLDLWGGSPADECTSNAFFGCDRSSNGANIINPIQSARVRTADTFSYKFGRVEVSAKLPVGDWIWPAIWMLPAKQQYGVWPASGEIDILESRGNAPGYPEGGYDRMGSTLHWGPFYGQDQWPLTHAETSAPTGTTFASGFHTYGMEWTDSYMFTYVDTRDNVVLNVTLDDFWQMGGWSGNADLNNPWASGTAAAPFDQEFYFIFNVAVGGTAGYFPDGVGGKCWKNSSPTAALDFWNCKDQWAPTWVGDAVAMQIDWINVYQ